MIYMQNILTQCWRPVVLVLKISLCLAWGLRCDEYLAFTRHNPSCCKPGQLTRLDTMCDVIHIIHLTYTPLQWTYKFVSSIITIFLRSIAAKCHSTSILRKKVTSVRERFVVSLRDWTDPVFKQLSSAGNVAARQCGNHVQTAAVNPTLIISDDGKNQLTSGPSFSLINPTVTYQ